MGVIANNITKPYQCVTADQVAKVTLRGTVNFANGAGQPTSLSLTLFNTSGVAVDLATLNTGLQAAIANKALLSNIAGQTSINYTGTSVEMIDVNHPLLARRVFPAALNNAGGNAGGIAGQGMPAFVTAIVDFRSPLRGAWARGRLEVGPLGISQATPAAGTLGDNLNAASVTAMNGIFAGTEDANVYTWTIGGTKWQLVISTSGGNARVPGSSVRPAPSTNRVRQSQRVPDIDPITGNPITGTIPLTVFLVPVISVSTREELTETYRHKEIGRHRINRQKQFSRLVAQGVLSLDQTV